MQDILSLIISLQIENQCDIIVNEFDSVRVRTKTSEKHYLIIIKTKIKLSGFYY